MVRSKKKRKPANDEFYEIRKTNFFYTKYTNCTIAIDMKLLCAVKNAKDFNNETPLHWAAKYDQPETIQLLIQNGFDQTKLNKKGNAAVHLAVGTSSYKSIQVFLSLMVNLFLFVCPIYQFLLATRRDRKVKATGAIMRC